MDENSRRRRQPQLPPSASSTCPPRGSRQRVPREIPDAERPELTLSEDQKRAIERTLSEDQKRAIERALQQSAEPSGPHSGTRLPPRVPDGEALLRPRMKDAGPGEKVCSSAVERAARDISIERRPAPAPTPPIQVQLVDSKVELVEKPKPPVNVASQPETPPLPRELTAKEWITLEAQRLKRLDKIPVGINKTEFAKMLKTNMKEAARTDRLISISPVGWRYIVNHLQEWALWPISAIE